MLLRGMHVQQNATAAHLLLLASAELVSIQQLGWLAYSQQAHCLPVSSLSSARSSIRHQPLVAEPRQVPASCMVLVMWMAGTV